MAALIMNLYFHPHLIGRGGIDVPTVGLILWIEGRNMEGFAMNQGPFTNGQVMSIVMTFVPGGGIRHLCQ